MKQLKRWISCFLVVVFLIIPIQNIVFAEETEDVWNGEIASGFDGGNGTSSDPYRIANAEQLAYFAATVNNGTTYKESYIALTADIHLNDIDDFDTWGTTAPVNNWTPIGKSSVMAFSGFFDGKNHTIRGMYISTNGAAGLFGALKNGTIANLNIDYSFVRGASAAGLVTNIYTSSNTVAKISNVTFTGRVLASAEYAGGIFGYYEKAALSSCSVSDCNVKGSISGISNVGGIGGSGSGCNITKCNVNADILGTKSRIGGIVGANATVSDSQMHGSIKGDTQVGGIIGYKGGGYNIVAVSYCSNNSVVTGNSQVGGIMGYGWSGPIIDECYNTGFVSGASKAGGIVGHFSQGGTARNCYNTGAVSAQKYAGGIVGHGQYDGAGATLCYNTGTVTGDAICGGTDYGGSVTKCYYSQDSGTSTRGTALSKTAMKHASSFSAFDFSKCWTMNSAAGRPVLKNTPEIMQDASCQILVLDVNTGEAIVGAHVEYNGNVAITDNNGIAVITAAGHCYTSNFILVVSKLGYENFKCYLSDLNVDYDVIVSNTILCVPIGDIPDDEATQNIYTNEHISFYLGSFDTISNDYGFYNTVWQYEDGKRLWACYTWDVLGDVGEVLTLSFDDLTISADFYDLYVADLIMSLVEDQTFEDDELLTKAAEIYEDCYDTFTNSCVTNLVAIIEEDELLRQDLEDIFSKDSLINQTLSETLSDRKLLMSDLEKILKGEKTSINPGVKIVYEKVCGKALTDESLFQQIFAGFSAATEIASFYTDAIDVVQEVGNACIVAESCKEVNKEIFNILDSAAETLSKSNKKYGEWFQKSINKYRSIAEDEDVLRRYLIFESDSSLPWRVAYKGALQVGYNHALKKITKSVTYKYISKVFNIGIPQLEALVGTYNGTYKLLDRITQLSGKSEQYYIMNYIGPVEHALSAIVGNLGDEMVIIQTYGSAQKFDLAYQALCATNKYLYESAYNFAALQKNAEEMQFSTYYKNAWNLNSCHDNYVIDRSKYISIQCPVDVFLYDSDGNLVVAIVDEEVVTYADEAITVVTCDGRKSLMFPADKDYSIKIISRESGKMEYYVSEAEDVVAYRNVEFYDLLLEQGQLYTGNIPCDFGIPNTEYMLVTGTENVICDYDSLLSESCVDGHAFDEWSIVEESSCVTDGLKVRYCSTCSKKEKAVVRNAPGHNYESVVVPPTCTEQGYTTYTCSCGDSYVSDYVGSLGHAMGNWYTTKEVTCTNDGEQRRDCSRCDHFETQVITSNGHSYSKKVTAPTCTEQGYTTYTCSTCGDSYVSDYVASLGHAMGNWYTTKEATCTSDGEQRRDCSRCDHYETDVITSSGHHFGDDTVCDNCGFDSTAPEYPENALMLSGEEFAGQDTVWIEGLPYPVEDNGVSRYVELPTEDDCYMVTYTYHTGDASDIHTQYPTGMKVYKVSDGQITYIPELDNLLQYSGASIRITGKKGIRMITSLTKTNKTALTGKGLAGFKLLEYGTALCFAHEIPQGDALVLGRDFTRSNYAYKKGVADPVFASTKDLIQYTNVLVGFSLDQCKDDIAMRPYIILEDAAGNQITLYGGTIYRSIGYIAYQNRTVFKPKTASYNYVWELIHHVYGDKYDADYKG